MPTNVERARVALVTGANKGIGNAITRRLAELGMRVYLGSRDDKRGETAARALASAGLDVRFIRLDVLDESSISLAAEHIDAHEGRLDVLINNAAVGGPASAPSETAVSEVRYTYETNVFGVIAVTNTMLPLLRRSPAARIVNVSSELGSLTYGAADLDASGVFPPGEFPRFLAYNSAKAAVNSITVTYANELRGTGILVNAASPGFVATDMNGHRGTRRPAEGARIPVLLAVLGDDGPTATFLGDDGTPAGRLLAW